MNIKNLNKDAFETLTPINLFLKIFCLTILGRQNNSIKITCSLFRRILTIAMIIIITLALCMNDMMVYTSRNIHFFRLLTIVYIYGAIQYIVDLRYVFKFGGIISLKYFKIYDQTDHVLGVTQLRYH